MLAKSAATSRQMRMASAKSRPGRAKPQMPATDTAISAAGDTRLASTAAVPTTRPPIIDTVCPMDWGSCNPASCRISKASSKNKTSKIVGNGTSFLLSTMLMSRAVGIIS